MDRFAQCEECHKSVDVDDAHVALTDDDGEFFMHIECFVAKGYLKDCDVTGRAVAESLMNKN